MNTRKFTPGPWIADLQSIRNSKGTWLATCHDVELKEGRESADKNEDYANARLIAAAPDMYDMLASILVEQESHGEHGDSALKTAIAALLKRADGNTE